VPRPWRRETKEPYEPDHHERDALAVYPWAHEPVREPRDLRQISAAQLSRPRLVRLDELTRELDRLT
jgi:hypothetical protein